MRTLTFTNVSGEDIINQETVMLYHTTTATWSVDNPPQSGTVVSGTRTVATIAAGATLTITITDESQVVRFYSDTIGSKIGWSINDLAGMPLSALRIYYNPHVTGDVASIANMPLDYFYCYYSYNLTGAIPVSTPTDCTILADGTNINTSQSLLNLNAGGFAGTFDANSDNQLVDDIDAVNAYYEIQARGGTVNINIGTVEIATAAELELYGTLASAGVPLNAQQVADITLSGEWEPIGSPLLPFDKNYDGSGYAIAGLYINQPEKDDIGLFGHTTAGNIQHLQLLDCNITGRDNAGALIGHSASAINDIQITGAVTGRDNVGLLAGYRAAILPMIIRVAGYGEVTGNSGVGGLVGSDINDSAVLTEAVAAVEVTGNSNVGPLVGSGVVVCLENAYWNSTIAGVADNGVVSFAVELTATEFADYNNYPSLGTEGLFWYMSSGGPKLQEFWVDEPEEPEEPIIVEAYAGRNGHGSRAGYGSRAGFGARVGGGAR